MRWVLIVSTLAVGQVHVTRVPGFTSETQCLDAAQAVKAHGERINPIFISSMIGAICLPQDK